MIDTFSLEELRKALAKTEEIPKMSAVLLVDNYRDAVENADQGHAVSQELLPFYEREMIKRMKRG